MPDNIPTTEHPEPAARALVTMRCIGKSFPGARVLEDVSFSVLAGEVHILAGENGAGKSTLIKILSGVHTDYEGSIEVAGRAARFRSPLDAVHQGVSVIHQELSLIPAMSVMDNLYLGRERGGLLLDRSKQLAGAKEALAQLGLDIDVNRPVEDFPLAVQQMIEVAKALLCDARVIIMDEPTSALGEVERLFAVIAKLKTRGCGIVFISHRMEEIYRIGDRVTVLRDGKLIGSAPLKGSGTDIPVGANSKEKSTDKNVCATRLPRNELIHWMVGRELETQSARTAPEAGKELLRVEGLHVRGDSTNTWAVEDVSFSLHAGEILGVAGLQGSGKSALLHGLFGDYGRLPRGAITLDEVPYSPRSPQHAIANGLALVTNDRKATGLVLGQGTTRNITLASLAAFSRCGWMLPAKEEAAARRHVAALDIRAATLEQDVATLSGGNQQKVVLGKWLETRPKVLMLDEPTRGVDVAAKQAIYALMREWTRAGIGILLVTSELPELLELSDRVLVLHRGRATALLSRADATPEAVLEAAMGGVEVA